MTSIPVRITLTDVWDEFRLDLPSETPLSHLKQRVLELGRVTSDPARYVVKYRGAQLEDEAKSLAELGVVRNAALIMLLRRRQPVR
jgi:hypothetical protein